MWVQIIIIVFVQVLSLIGIVQFLVELASRYGCGHDWEVAARPKLLQVLAISHVRTNLQT